MLRCAERVQGVAGQRSKHFPPTTRDVASRRPTCAYH